MLREWCDAQQNIYVAFFEPVGVQTLTGRVTAVSDHDAVVTDTVVTMTLPLSHGVDALFAESAEGSGTPRSITLSWPDGRSAFLVVR